MLERVVTVSELTKVYTSRGEKRLRLKTLRLMSTKAIFWRMLVKMVQVSQPQLSLF